VVAKKTDIHPRRFCVLVTVQGKMRFWRLCYPALCDKLLAFMIPLSLPLT